MRSSAIVSFETDTGLLVQSVGTCSYMTDENVAGEARKGLLDGIKGKAKEVVGAVTGNDSLTAEGQLQAAQARERKEAHATERVAEAQATDAAEELADVRTAAESRREAAEENAAVTEAQADRVRETQVLAAEQNKREAVAQERAAAEVDATAEQIEADEDRRIEQAAADSDEMVAAQKHQEALRQAEADRKKAEELRNQA